jgi:hypothetical protein
MRENPEYRLRNKYVTESYELTDSLNSLMDKSMGKLPQWARREIGKQIRLADSLKYPLIQWRDSVPKEIED